MFSSFYRIVADLQVAKSKIRCFVADFNDSAIREDHSLVFDQHGILARVYPFGHIETYVS